MSAIAGQLRAGVSSPFRTAFSPVAVLGLSGACFTVLGQESPAPKPKFEAASVRRSGPGIDRYDVRVSPSTMIYTGITLRLLSRTAWRIQDLQIVGGPAWIDSARFDISAKLYRPHPPVEMLAMLQDLLEERFRLVLAPERRAHSHYSLVPSASTDGKHPGLIRANDDECRLPDGAPKPDPVCGGVRIKPEGNAVQYSATSIPMSQFALSLTGVMNSWVDNKTELEGKYDIRLSWPLGVGANPPSEGSAPDATFIFRPLQNELGLKLEPVKGPVPVFVVQRAEMPTEN